MYYQVSVFPCCILRFASFRSVFQGDVAGPAESAASVASLHWVRSEIFRNFNPRMEPKEKALGVCGMMGVAYVALLYAPAVFLPSPKSVREHTLRRFAFAAVASSLAPILCLAFLPVNLGWESDWREVLAVFGLRTDHLWQAIILPTVLTGMLYLGPVALLLFYFIEWCWAASHQENGLLRETSSAVIAYGKDLASDILVWRNCFVAPVSEELVFRACMVPLLLCGGFSPLVTVFLCPLFFGLAHLHHFWELIYQKKHTKSTAALIVGMQLGYTTIFGWYATFLYLRTGHLIVPIMAHIFCNTMGLPDIEEAMASSHRKVIGVAYIVGIVGFFTLLGPMSDPGLFNDVMVVKRCSCWSGFCKWAASHKLEKLVE
ncbi:hypothetical protein R1sor_013127 [Riccia sorocarpa]|uniref:intramembrane prenyl-peptidase Rce1 n=1 Tax=Riccia sorocarpa TaxID=122646 RepID=A0ABD3H5T2_9MARC